jgi:L-threonylcarbamoyladenylate synthase
VPGELPLPLSGQTLILPTDSAPARDHAVAAAVQELRAGNVVALPTETVYGLAADALRPEAVVKIFEAKQRPFFDPLICHLPSLDWLGKMTQIPAASQPLVDALTSRFWPGPLTLVLPRSGIVPDLVTSGLETVALRMSAHPVFQRVVQAFGSPLSAPSANRFGRISPTAASHVQAELGGRIPLILDGGPTLHGLESTIVAVEGAAMRILRSGPISREELQAFGPILEAIRTAEPEAPGQMKSHYAPRTPLILVQEWDEAAAHFAAGKRIGVLAWSEAPDLPADRAAVLSRAGDLREAAATLFAKLRELDEAGLDVILAGSGPEEGLGAAIMDRLRKAAGLG